MFDVIVIGIGPSAVSLSINLARFKLKPILLYKDKGLLSKAKQVDNYYGVPKTSGTSLIELGIKQLDDFGIVYKQETVFDIAKKDDGFLVTSDKGEYKSRFVVLATGIDRKTSITGLDNLVGRGVSYCVKCDGLFYQSSKVALLGSDEYAEHEMSLLENYTNDIHLFTNGNNPTFNTSHNVIKDRITKVTHNFDDTINIETNNGLYKVDGCFVALSPNSNALSNKLGLETHNSFISVDKNFETNIKGLFAIGDVIGEPFQVAKAVSDGLLCAIAIKNRS